MIDPKKIEQIARQVHESMPKGIREFGEDVEKKIRQSLQAQLTRLDLVSREEFDVQTQVLLRTREKLALLEQRLVILEHLHCDPELDRHAVRLAVVGGFGELVFDRADERERGFAPRPQLGL